jgi:hypothetical protein
MMPVVHNPISTRSSRLALRSAAALLPLLVLTHSGCGPYESRLPETGATLEGAITVGGETVPMALVVVVGEKGQATGQIEEGRYKVENAPLGEVKIGVNTDAVRGQLISQQMSQSYKGPGKGGPKAAPLKFVEVPAKYREAEKSGITTKIKRGKNAYDISLTK